MKYAFINGDELTKFDPLAVVYNNGKFEFICQSHERQKHYYEHVKNVKYESLEQFVSTFSYFNVETGDVTPDVESLLNRLRARFVVSQIADHEINADNQQNQYDARRDNALLKISKRMRTGANER